MLRLPVQEVKPAAVRVNRVSDPLMFREVLARAGHMSQT